MGDNTLGKITIQAGDKTYTLQLTANALCSLEDELGGLGAEEFGKLGAGSMVMMRTMFCAALQEHHPGLDKAAAGRIIDAVGFKPAMTALMEAIFASGYIDRPTPGAPRPLAGEAAGAAPTPG